MHTVEISRGRNLSENLKRQTVVGAVHQHCGHIKATMTANKIISLHCAHGWASQHLAGQVNTWLAVRILAQTTSRSAAAVESAWLEFGFVFNRRRSCMDKERANKLVYVHCNIRLLRRFKSASAWKIGSHPNLRVKMGALKTTQWTMAMS